MKSVKDWLQPDYRLNWHINWRNEMAMTKQSMEAARQARAAVWAEYDKEEKIRKEKRAKESKEAWDITELMAEIAAAEALDHEEIEGVDESQHYKDQVRLVIFVFALIFIAAFASVVSLVI